MRDVFSFCLAPREERAALLSKRTVDFAHTEVGRSDCERKSANDGRILFTAESVTCTLILALSGISEIIFANIKKCSLSCEKENIIIGLVLFLLM